MLLSAVTCVTNLIAPHMSASGDMGCSDGRDTFRQEMDDLRRDPALQTPPLLGILTPQHMDYI